MRKKKEQSPDPDHPAAPVASPRSVALRGRAKADSTTPLDTVLEVQSKVGREIKDLRKACAMTLAQLSQATGLSQGYLSQIERGISSPSVKALHSISRALGVTISWFFPNSDGDDEDISAYVVRKDRRRTLTFQSGITDELLSPNLSRGLELLRCTFAPRSHSGKETYEHQGEEAGIVISGTLTLWLGEKRVDLAAGDSFAFESTLPHRYANDSDEEAVIIWVISPPSY